MADNRDVIRERMLSNLPNRFDKNTGTFTWEVYQGASIEYENMGILLENGLNQAFAGTADLEHLKIIAFEDRGITYRDSVPSSGVLKVIGVEGSVIEIGDLFASELHQYQSLKRIVVGANGEAYVPVECMISGAVGNTPPNTIINFPKSILGINSVTNEVEFNNGVDEEGRDSLLSRYYLQIRKSATSGNINHYIQWATDVKGVGAVKIKPIWNGGGTVKVVILDQDKKPATPELITSTGEYIETQRPIGADVTVATATELDMNITCNIQVLKDYTLVQAKEDIQKNLEAYFKEMAFDSFEVYYARVGNIIFNSLGVNNIDYASLTINGLKDDIILLDTNTETQIPKVGILNITETI